MCVSQAMSFGPAIIYNVPSRTSQDIGPDIIEPLSKPPYFLGVKECAGDDRIKYYADKGIASWSGNDDQCHKSRYESGAAGVISVTSNIAPSLMRSLMFDGKKLLVVYALGRPHSIFRSTAFLEENENPMHWSFL